MFGYLFPTKSLLTMSEKKIFRNYFCTLCLAHNYRYGMLAPALNNFDIGTFAIILDLYGDKIENCGKCGKYIANRREKFTTKKWAEIVDYNVNLVRKKIEDDLTDKAGVQATSVHLATKHIFNKCKRNSRDLYTLFDTEFDKYMIVESEKPQINEMLHSYEEFARNTFGALDRVKSEQVELFVAMNRWIYWIDAIDDYDEDLRSGSFNPYVCYRNSDSKSQFLKDHMLQLIDMYESLKESIEIAYSRCFYPPENKVILENIINHTIRNTTKLILENRSLPKRRRLL